MNTPPPPLLFCYFVTTPRRHRRQLNQRPPPARPHTHQHTNFPVYTHFRWLVPYSNALESRMSVFSFACPNDTERSFTKSSHAFNFLSLFFFLKAINGLSFLSCSAPLRFASTKNKQINDNSTRLLTTVCVNSVG